ncbi:MAG: YbjN domain-containing protein [Pseudomonadota bacterium]
MLQKQEIDLFSDVANPLDFVEEVMSLHDWTFERVDEGEISVQVSGEFSHYTMSFVWQDDVNALDFKCSVDIDVIAEKRLQALEAINEVNSKLWLGHFDLPKGQTQPRFRHTSLLRGMTEGSGIDLIEDLIQIALAECERYVIAFDLLSKTEEQSAAINTDKMNLALMDVSGIS